MAGINWKDLFKVKIANSDQSMEKHEIIKTLLVMKLLHKHRKSRNYVIIYTEFKLDNGLTCDVYYENLKTKEAFAFEIQRNISKKWIKDRTEKYKDWEVNLFNSADWIPIPLKEAPEDINELSKWLEEYLVKWERIGMIIK